ncbi:MAG: HAD family hydrolase, partial [Planctomycetaceae bacterium]|nr:HAD family hydrolase [Planctomycetaceae bacterium]
MSALGLSTFQKKHDFLIGIDSDGCAFDSMEIKHKECFIPNFIKYMGLQPISKYAREACEFTNLYSKTRGANRFPAYLLALDLL